MKTLFLATLLLAGLTGLAQAQDASVPAEGIAWYPFEEAVAMAKKQNKKLIVDIYAPWCPWCRRLQREVYSEKKIQDYLAKNFIMTRLDGENKADSLRFKQYTLTPAELSLGLGTQGYPNTVFLEADGDYITRLPGYANATEFMQVLSYIGSDAFVDKSYQEFVESKETR